MQSMSARATGELSGGDEEGSGDSAGMVTEHSAMTASGWDDESAATTAAAGAAVAAIGAHDARRAEMSVSSFWLSPQMLCIGAKFYEAKYDIIEISVYGDKS